MPINKIQTVFAIATLLVFTVLATTWWPQETAGFDIPEEVETHDSVPFYHEQFISFVDANKTAVHAASATLRQDGKIFAAWFAGSREGASDVAIDSTVIDPVTHAFSPTRPIASRLQTAKDVWRYIRKLGNPLVHQLDNGRLMLVYVSVSFGGWAASSLNIRFSDDKGLSWSPASRIITSPFLNISTLVKGTPVEFADGNIGLPVYHEFLGKFGELLVISPRGQVLDKHRLSSGRQAIQPVIVPLSDATAIGLLRDSGEEQKRVALTRTSDHGQHWTPLVATELPNPNSAVTAIRAANRGILMVFNNHEEERNILSLAISKDDGESWRVIHDFENQPPQAGKKIKYSYPYLIRGDNNDYHLFYTWRKSRIKYVHFNDAWLRSLQ